jgi:hypothetical protein
MVVKTGIRYKQKAADHDLITISRFFSYSDT